VVITAGVLAGTGDLQLWLVILCASAGAIAGDNISYGLGHWLGEHTCEAVVQGGEEPGRVRVGGAPARSARDVHHRRRALHPRAVERRRRSRRATSSRSRTGGSSWRTSSPASSGDVRLALGYFGGKTFEEQPWKGLILAFVVAIGLAGATSSARPAQRRRAAAPRVIEP
jgi:hypothetical protein